MQYGRFNIQGYFGECFVRVLASAAGLVAGERDVDTTGVDFSIELPGTRGTTRYPRIDAQVKSWSSPRGNDVEWHYPMEIRHFNDLAGTGFQVTRFLFLVIVPPEQAQYVAADHDLLRLRHCGYWVSLTSREPIDPQIQRWTTVRVPRRNVLTPESLRALVQPVPVQRVSTS